MKKHPETTGSDEDITALTASTTKLDLNAGNTVAASTATIGLYRAQGAHNEIQMQQYAHDRFFRMGRANKQDSKSNAIYALLLDIDKLSPDIVKNLAKAPSKYGEFSDAEKQSVCTYLKKKIILDNCTSRSIIIALSRFLNEKKYLPTAIYTIGKTHILCMSRPTQSLLGNVNLQTITENGDVLRTPLVYGDGNGNMLNSCFVKLSEISEKYPSASLSELMRQSSRMIQSIDFLGADNTPFLDSLNFLRAIIEVARYSYRQGDDVVSNLNRLPIGISQQRTSQLLIDKIIKLFEAYGIDKTIYSGSTPRTPFGSKKEALSPDAPVHKAPYGVVTGTSLKDNIEEVGNKTRRINRAYLQQYAKYTAQINGVALTEDTKEKSLPKPVPSASEHGIIEGPTMLKAKLKEEFGSGNESDSSNYSDEESTQFSANLTKF